MRSLPGPLKISFIVSLLLLSLIVGGCLNSRPSQGPTVTPTASSVNGHVDNAAIDQSPPSSPVRLIFIHHSTGENWLADDNGGLGIALRDNNYFVSDTNYDWGPIDPQLGGPIGSYTDIGNWWNWFSGPNSGTFMRALFSESGQNCGYSRLETDPGGENQIIAFKSCFPNSGLQGVPGDAPIAGDNPLRGQGSGSEYHTMANAKGIYTDLLTYFASRQDKLFIVITAPPLDRGATDAEQAANARAFNKWLVEDWLKDYPYNNVAVFDFYDVLTSNGGPLHNDLGAAGGNHHRYKDGGIEYVTDKGSDYSAYTKGGDSHPTQAGNEKATGEFIPILNIAYHRWKGE